MKQLTLLIIVPFLFFSCAEEKDSAVPGASTTTEVPAQPSGPFVPPTGNGNTGSTQSGLWSYGATTPLTINDTANGEFDLATFSEFNNLTVVNPQNVRLNVNLVRRGQGYGGRIAISYNDQGVYQEWVLVNGDINNFPGDEAYDQNISSSEEAKVLEQAAKYNRFLDAGAVPQFHGFFQDFYGAVVLVIDGGGFQTGDGQGPTTVSGSLWFRNFDDTVAPYGYYHCWQIWAGPYDCRAWKDGEGVNTFRSLEPDNGYVKFATFTDINLEDAFNGNEIQ